MTYSQLSNVSPKKIKIDTNETNFKMKCKYRAKMNLERSFGLGNEFEFLLKSFDCRHWYFVKSEFYDIVEISFESHMKLLVFFSENLKSRSLRQKSPFIIYQSIKELIHLFIFLT